MKKLTKKQQEIMDFVELFCKREGMAPTIYEIADHFDIKPPTIVAHIRALQNKGYITRSSKARSIISLRNQTPEQSSLTFSIPLVQKIVTGKPVLAEENLERTIQYDPALLPHGADGHQLFGMQITDDGMSGVGMMEGDIVIVKHIETASIGDLVVVQVEGKDILVRSFYIHDKRVELRPAGSQFEIKIYAPEEVQIHGVVVGLHRRICG